MSKIPISITNAYGKIPNEWRLERLKFSALVRNSNVDKVFNESEIPVKLCNYTDVYYNETITYDMDFMQGSATELEIEKFQLKSGQVIITKDSEGWEDIGIPAVVKEDMHDVVCGYHLAVFTPDKTTLDGNYLGWLCRSDPLNNQFKLASNGVTRFGLGQYAMKNSYIVLPPLKTQKRIAEFLDKKTAQIDTLIEKKRTLLDRLAEKRQALITQAVTKGLNLDVPMKDSGVDWLGEIPAHWEVVLLKRILDNSDYGISASLKPEGDIAILRMGNLNNGELDFSELRYIDEIEEKLLIQKDDVIFNRTNSLDLVGKAAIYRGDYNGKLSLASYLVRFRFSEEYVPDFANYVMVTNVLLNYARTFALPSIGQANLNPNRYSLIKFPVPPLSEQRGIRDFLDSHCTNSREVTSKINESINKLAEYRSALITAAVTGKLTELN